MIPLKILIQLAKSSELKTKFYNLFNKKYLIVFKYLDTKEVIKFN